MKRFLAPWHIRLWRDVLWFAPRILSAILASALFGLMIIMPVFVAALLAP